MIINDGKTLAYYKDEVKKKIISRNFIFKTAN